jgi:2-alkyl-3-oxoalkanoate reductase
MKRVLVTGAGGFLGRHIVEQLLARGLHVVGFARGAYPELTSQGVQLMRGDIRDENALDHACAQIDTVFHTAAIAGIWGRRSDYYEINTLGTRNVLRACRRHGIPRLVFSSSPSVTFAAAPQCGVDESAPYPRRWLGHYSHSKALAEQQVLAANGCDGLSTCALRPHLIWGPGDPHLIPRLIERARRGKLLRVGDGSNRIDITYVENAAEAHLLAADRLQPGGAVAGRAYFISQGEPVNCWTWIDELLRLAGLPPVDRAIGYRTAWLAGQVLETVYRLIGSRREPRMTRFLAAQLALPHYFDISAACRDLQYQPRVSTTEGMQRLAAWLRPRD